MIREAQEKDRTEFYDMCDEFYNSEAVLHSVPKQYHINVFDEAMNSDTYLKIYVFECDYTIVGYSVLAKQFSTEVGGMSYWIEELYVRESFRNQGIGKSFFEFLESRYGNDFSRVRLEVEFDNDRAKKLYKYLGFEELEYLSMVKDKDIL